MGILDRLNQLLRLLDNLPQNMDKLVAYGQNILIILIVAVLIYAFRNVIGGAIGGIISILRYREMREIDARESEAKEAEAIVSIAKATSGNGPVTEADLIKAADVYYRLVKAARVSRKKNG